MFLKSNRPLDSTLHLLQADSLSITTYLLAHTLKHLNNLRSAPAPAPLAPKLWESCILTPGPL